MEELPPAAARPWQECDLLTQIRRPPFLLRGPTNPRANRSVSCIRHRLIPSHFLLLWTHSLIRARGKDHAKKSFQFKKDEKFPEGPSHALLRFCLPFKRNRLCQTTQSIALNRLTFSNSGEVLNFRGNFVQVMDACIVPPKLDEFSGNLRTVLLIVHFNKHLHFELCERFQNYFPVFPAMFTKALSQSLCTGVSKWRCMYVSSHFFTLYNANEVTCEANIKRPDKIWK